MRVGRGQVKEAIAEAAERIGHPLHPRERIRAGWMEPAYEVDGPREVVLASENGHLVERHGWLDKGGDAAAALAENLFRCEA